MALMPTPANHGRAGYWCCRCSVLPLASRPALVSRELLRAVHAWYYSCFAIVTLRLRWWHRGFCFPLVHGLGEVGECIIP